MITLPLTRHSMGLEEFTAAQRALSGPKLTQGPEVDAFEEEFAHYQSSPEIHTHAAATNACTSALYLTLRALGIGPGDEVITSPISWVATALALRWTGATVVFADVDDAGLLDPEHVCDVLTPRTRAIVPVHLYGQICDMSAFAELGRHEDIPIVYDAAHAIEGQYDNTPCGALGTASCYSFHATKNLTTAGEGGMVVTRYPEIADYVRRARCFGLRLPERICEHFGAKLGMTEVQAAVGRAQLRRLDGRYDRRVELWKAYLDVLPIVRPINREPGVVDALHLYAIFADRERVRAALEQAGIGYGIHYAPIYAHPEFVGTKPRHADNADRIGRRAISLPFFPEMTIEDVHRVGKALEGVL